ncbi:hypothetical protein G6F23_011810 [Rhizopus arrhizus]|nr:hypothetical protein G6F23_011810 [Rhizopus arrhizus]
MRALTNVASMSKERFKRAIQSIAGAAGDEQDSYDANESEFAINSDDSDDSDQNGTSKARSQNDYREAEVDMHLGHFGCDSYMHEIHRLAYIKAQGDIISKHNLKMLNQLREQAPDCIITSLLTLGQHYLAKDDLTIHEDMQFIISGIVNLLDKDMARIYQQNLTQDQWDQVLAQKDSMHLDDYLGLTTESNDIFDRIMDCGDNQLDILDFIDGQKAQLSKTKRQHDQCYQMLLIVEQVVRNFSRWSTYDDESELTLYRRFAALLDILFDSSDIIMIDGESVSKATKAAIDLNKTIFTLGEQSPSYGRKIDLILKHSNGKKRVEVSSNEWKRMGVVADLKIKQQCKNLRTNACILHQLNPK